MRHLTKLFDLSPDDVREILDRAIDLKSRYTQGERPRILEGRMLTQIFEKPSLRTRLSFHTAMVHLGGESAFFVAKDAGLHGRESLPDIARVVSGMSDAVVLRTFSQQLIEDFCEWSTVPVINGLSDDFHPCQSLTDVLTIHEALGGYEGRHIVYVGDGNNVAASLAIISGQLGLSLTVACPDGYQLPESFIERVNDTYPGIQLSQTGDPAAAVKDADVIYTDVWASMGQESEAKERQSAFDGFQVNADLMSKAPSTAKFMHDLPARRGLEVTDEVMDGPQSIAFQQAENRMHLAKGLLAWVLRK